MILRRIYMALINKKGLTNALKPVKSVKVTGTSNAPDKVNVSNTPGTVMRTDFKNLEQRAVRNLGIYNQLKNFAVSAGSIGAKEAVVVIPEEIKKELLECKNLEEVYTYTNSKNYYSTYYKIKGLNALFVEFKFKLQGMLEDDKIFYRVIPETVKSRSGKKHSVLDYLKNTSLRYGTKATEYSVNSENRNVERLILGLRDYDNDNAYKKEDGMVVHHDIQKAVLSVNTLAIGSSSEHIEYHHKHGCYSRKDCLLIRNLDDYKMFNNILRIIYN